MTLFLWLFYKYFNFECYNRKNGESHLINDYKEEKKMTTVQNSVLNTEKSIIISDESYFYGKVLPKVLLSENEKQEILAEFPAPFLPPSEKAVHIQDFQANELVSNLVVLINEFEVKIASNNNPYLDVVLSNNRGSFKAKMWADSSSIDEHVQFFEQNTVITVSGKVDEFPKGSGNKSLTIRTYLPFEKEINPLALLPVTDKDLEKLTLELVYYVKQLQEPHRRIALTGLKNIWKGFSVAPGAKFHHHAYLGGLMKHTIGLIRLSLFLGKEGNSPSQTMMGLLQVIEKEHRIEMSDSLVSGANKKYQKLTWAGSVEHIYELVYNFAILHKEQPLDVDLLVSSALYHDFAKYFELSFYGQEKDKYSLLFPFTNNQEKEQKVGGIAMDEFGSLMGHIPLGMLYFQRSVEAANVDVSMDLMSQYIHNILSHHGKLEWGTSVTPKTATAIALHFVDYLDSRYENYELNIKK